MSSKEGARRYQLGSNLQAATKLIPPSVKGLVKAKLDKFCKILSVHGIINIKNVKWKDDFSPVDPDGETFADTQYSKAFLRHLFISGEILAAMIATTHNLGFYIWLMREARKEITLGTFAGWKERMVKQLMQRL